jgi:hypothetical protein
MRARTWLLIGFSIAALATPGAQPQSASIAGQVLNDDPTPRPVAGAIVTASGGDLVRPTSVVTDAMGRFVFPRLSGSRFTLTASKPPYIISAYGAKRPGRQGTPVSLAAGQQIDGLTIQMARSSVISGTLRDARGNAVPNVDVVAVRVDQPGGSEMVSRIRSEFTSDDRGAYRIFGLLPGDYVVAAGNMIVTSVEVTLSSDAENEAALRELASGRSGGSAPSPAQKYVRSATFFPGVNAPGEAERISLRAGEERVADFVVKPVPAVSVSGVVSGPPGAAQTMLLTLTTEGPEVPGVMMARPALQRPGADGRFVFTGVTPGKYALVARTPTVTSRGGGGGGAGASAPAGTQTGSGPVLWARADLDVTGRDVEGVVLALQPGMKFAGRVVFDASSSPPPSDLTALRVALAAPPLRSPATGILGPQLGVVYVPPGAVRADGTLRSAMGGGRDVLDSLLEFGNGGDVSGAVLTFTDKHSEISGALQTQSGAAATDYFVVAFSSDRAMWRPGSRRMQSTRPATDGHYSFKDLPAGEYLIVALTDFEPRDLDDPAFLESVAPSALKVALGEGERKVQDLRLAR